MTLVWRKTGFAFAAFCAAAMLAPLAGAPAPALAQPAPRAGAPVEIVNRHSVTLYELYIVGAERSDWGRDRLGSDVIAPGQRFRVTLEPEAGCRVNIRAIYEDRRTEDRRDVDVCAAREQVFAGADTAPPAPTASPRAAPRPTPLPPRTQARPPASPPASPPAAPPRPAAPALPAPAEDQFGLLNRSGRAIAGLFVAPADAAGWGENRAGTPLAQGARANIGFDRAGGCAQNIRVVFDNQSAEERRRIDLCQTRQLAIGPGWTTAETLPPVDRISLRLVNQARRSMIELYLRAPGANGWGRDRLGSSTVSAGQRHMVELEGEGCVFDVRATFGAGREALHEGLDLCAVNELALAPPAATRTLTIVNQSGRTIVAIYAQPQDGGRRSGDLLGSDMVSRDARYELEMPEGSECTYDLTFEFGGAREQQRVDICTTRELMVAAPGPGTTARPPRGDAPGSAAGAGAGDKPAAGATPPAAGGGESPGAGKPGPSDGPAAPGARPGDKPAGRPI
ncbi:MAG: hypothetical protein IT557_16555 [Alphaproteobacteria bacterium]|nr:hypothetical protein [Alphaproteobacteria bacterium]